MKKCLFAILIFIYSPTFAQIPEGYKLETITLPKGAITLLGVCEKDENTIAICTWEGQIWELNNGKWHLFAEDLMEPNGIYYDKDEQAYYLAQKPELTRVKDTNGDGKADLFETVTADFGYTKGYHEYHFGPVVDSLGRKYASLNLSARKVDGKGLEVRAGRPGEHGVMVYTAPYRGWVYRSDRQGHFHPIATGFRSPCGIGMSPKDELFITDNQGDWMPDCALFHVQEGKFYGHPGGLAARPDFDDHKILSMTNEDFSKIRTMPTMWLPRTFISNSPGSPVWDTTKGKFGYFKDQFFIGDQAISNLIRCGIEEVGGAYQGWCIQFLKGTQSGTVKMEFDKDGNLWTAQVGRGWRSQGGKRTALQKISWDGKTIPFEIYEVNITEEGFKITFTDALNKEVLPLVKSWHYNYSAIYGSDRVDEKNHTIQSMILSKDKRVLDIKVQLEKHKVYEISFPELTSANDKKLVNSSVYYTVNNLLTKQRKVKRVKPIIPGSGWRKNDARRPAPAVVKPKSFAETTIKTPKNAVVLDDSKWSNPNWKTDTKGLWKRGKGNFSTKKAYGDARIHIEFMVAKSDDPQSVGQLYGNSGIFLMSGYEIQVMNSYKNPTTADGSCGSIWGQAPPLVNASRQPGQWQSYDILMKAPVFDDQGKLIEPMRATVFHNGELIHNDAWFYGQVNKPYQAHGKRPLMIQDHKGSDVFFRNIWILEDVDYDKSLDLFRSSFKNESQINHNAQVQKPITVLNRNMVSNMDLNANEIITEEEFIGFWSKQFNEGDKNKDGVLSLEEFPHEGAFRGADKDKTNSLNRLEHRRIYSSQFPGLDRNQDGIIDYQDK